MQHGPKRQRSEHRVGRWLVAAGIGVVLLAGCGSDDDSDGESAQEKYCQAGSSLEESVTALADVDLLAEGTDGLESALDAVDDDLNTLGDTASDAAADEVDALEQSVDDLQSAISDLGGEISSENVSSLTTAVQSVGTAAQGVYGTLSDCP